MAVVERTIIAGGGGNYTTIAAWEAATNLNSGNDIWKGVISDNSAYDELVAIATNGTSTTSYVWLTAASANRHAGVWSTSKARHVYTGGSSEGFEVNGDYARVDWLQFHRPASGSYGSSDEVVSVDASDNVLLDYLIVWTDDNEAKQVGIIIEPAASSNVRISNSCIWGFGRASIHFEDATGAQTGDIDHCALGPHGDISAPSSPLVVSQSSANTTTVNVYNTWLHSETKSDVTLEANNASAVVNLNGSHNCFLASDISESGTGTTNVNWTSNVDSGPDELVDTAPATGGIYVTESAITGFDGTPVDHANNDILEAATNRQGSEPDSRQDFSVDITGGSRPTSSVDIGPFQITAGAAATSLVPPRRPAHATLITR